MKVVVTGGAGYIGSHACKALASLGHEVIAYDNLVTGHKKFVQFGPFEYGSVNDYRRLSACFRKYQPQAVIHFAALSEVGQSVRDPGSYFRNNVDGTLTILEAMRDVGIPAIVVSGTSAVYGQPEIMPIPEDCPTNPINPYGESKLFMEKMLASFARAHGLSWMSLRYFNAAGSSPDGEIGELHLPETHLIPLAIQAALGQRGPLQVFGSDYPTPDGTCIRDYIDVQDLARAHILAVEYLLDGGPSQSLNLGSGTGNSVLEVLQGIEEVSGRKVPHVLAGRRLGDPARLIADAANAARILGWKPEMKLPAMLENAWRFLEKNYKNGQARM